MQRNVFHPAPAPNAAPARGLHLQRRCACGTSAGLGGHCADCARQQSLGMQTRLVVGPADDRYEREAEQVAQQVLTGPAAVQGRAAPRIQRRSMAPQADDNAVPASVQATLANSGEPLAPTLRSDMEQRLGHDFSQVRVHADAQADRSAREVGAQAYTVGRDMAFASGQYAPGTAAGRHLIAHELTHVVQQSAGTAMSLQRQPATPAAPTPVVPNARQQRMIDAARRAAAIRTQVAMFRTSGVEGKRWAREARSLARIKFDWPNPNMDQISDILSGMGGGLVDVQVLVAGGSDPECGIRPGYVRGLRPPIVLCPAFFAADTDDESRIRTMVHEMAHARGIGSADAMEQYFPVFDCESTGVFESADTWSNYVHCLSGQPPDAPEQITAVDGSP